MPQYISHHPTPGVNTLANRVTPPWWGQLYKPYLFYVLLEQVQQTTLVELDLPLMPRFLRVAARIEQPAHERLDMLRFMVELHVACGRRQHTNFTMRQSALSIQASADRQT